MELDVHSKEAEIVVRKCLTSLHCLKSQDLVDTASSFELDPHASVRAHIDMFLVGYQYNQNK
jgi:hypothetical protein